MSKGAASDDDTIAGMHAVICKLEGELPAQLTAAACVMRLCMVEIQTEQRRHILKPSDKSRPYCDGPYCLSAVDGAVFGDVIRVMCNALQVMPNNVSKLCLLGNAFDAGFVPCMLLAGPVASAGHEALTDLQAPECARHCSIPVQHTSYICPLLGFRQHQSTPVCCCQGDHSALVITQETPDAFQSVS